MEFELGDKLCADDRKTGIKTAGRNNVLGCTFWIAHAYFWGNSRFDLTPLKRTLDGF